MKFIAAVLLCFLFPVAAQVPNLLSHQGRVAVRGVNFDGNGLFKFALVDARGNTTYWSNDGTSSRGSEPADAVRINVSKGLYSVLLGDTSLSNMAALPASVFSNSDVRLRVWFDDTNHGSELLTPDERLAPNGYLPDGSVTAAKLAPGAGFSAVTVTGPNHDAAANGNYVVTSATPVSFTLPATANVGDTIQITGVGAGGWFMPGGAHDNWLPVETARAWAAIASSADGLKLVAVANNDRIYTSTDAGASWSPRGESASWKTVTSSSDGVRLFAAGFSGHSISTNSGVTWTPLQASGAWLSLASSADGLKLVAAVGAGSFPPVSGLATSIDGGQTWTPRTATFTNTATWTAVASSSDGVKLFAALDGGAISVSTNSGATWTAVGPAANWRALTCSSDGTRVNAAGEGSPIYFSADSGQTWNFGGNFRSWRGLTSSADGLKLAAVAENDRVYTSSDGGVTWEQRAFVRAWSGIASSADGLRLAATTNGGQIYTSFEVFASGAPGTEVTLAYTGAMGWKPVIPASFLIQSTQIENGAVMLRHLAPDALLWTPSNGNIVRNSGNVGIGTATPHFGLSLGNGIANTKLALYDNGPDFSYGLGIQSAQFRFHVDAPTARFSFLDGPAGNELVTILGTGNVGIGRNPAANRLEVAGDASKSTAGAWIANSDRRIKTDIRPVTGALETLERVRPVSFRYSEAYRRSHPDINDVLYYNVIAQEFREVFPNSVKSSGEKLPDGSEILQVDTYPATITAIAAIKELKAENDELKRRLFALEKTVRRTQNNHSNAAVTR